MNSLPCWCGAQDWRVCFRTVRFGLLRCRPCGTYRIDPPPLERDEESSEFYSEYYGSVPVEAGDDHGDERGPSRFGRVVRQVPLLRQAGERALDVGCGEGHLCAELKASGWQSVTGVDVSRARIARARQSYPDVEFHDRHLQDVGIGNHTLDLVIMDNVIEHLASPFRMLEAVRGLLKNGGRLVVITPNMRSGHFRLLGRRWTPELSPHSHIFLFTPSSLIRILALAHFMVEKAATFHLRPLPLCAWVQKVSSGDIKGALWTAAQEAGGLYGRLIGAGPMVYAVARVDAR